MLFVRWLCVWAFLRWVSESVWTSQQSFRDFLQLDCSSANTSLPRAVFWSFHPILTFGWLTPPSVCHLAIGKLFNFSFFVFVFKPRQTDQGRSGYLHAFHSDLVATAPINMLLLKEGMLTFGATSILHLKRWILQKNWNLPLMHSFLLSLKERLKQIP